MVEKSIDLEGMFKELELIKEKYGIPRGMLFVPDKIKITLERKEINKFEITYSEFFNYLPHYILKDAIEWIIPLIQQMGISPENITRIENGIKVQISGDFGVVLFPIGELFIQNKNIESEIKSHLDHIYKSINAFYDFYNLNWDFDEKIEEKWNNLIMTLYNIIQNNPSVASEMDAIIKKYTAS